MSQGVRYVLCVQEELNLIPSARAISQVWRLLLYSKLGKTDTQSPQACWLPAESTW